MDMKSINKDCKLSIWDRLLIIGVITSPMTSLRVWKVGIAELSIFIWSIRMIVKGKFKIKVDQYILFFLLFDMCLFLGFANRRFKGIYTGSPIDESMTFIYFTIFIIALSQFLQKTTKDKILKIYEKIFTWGFIIYFGLYLFSITISKSIFGYPLWYGDRLSILANNPHQFVFFVGPAILLGLLLVGVKYTHSKVKILLTYVAAVGFFYMGIQSKSSTFFATIFVIIIYILLFKPIAKEKGKQRGLIIGMKISLLLIVIIIGYNVVFDYFIKFVESDPNGIGRLILWKKGIKKAIENPVFGLGPGAHLYDPYLNIFMEAHNTYIDIVLRAGIVGLILYLAILYKSIKGTKINVYATSIIFFFCLYGMAGYSIRRITLWFFVMSISYYCCKREFVQN